MAAVFFSYSHKDEALRDQLETHLALLRHQGLIEAWHDRRIAAGDEFDGAILSQLEAADIILLLVSSDFIGSNYCYAREMQRALARHEAGTARVIPVILRPCDWTGAPFGGLLAVPRDGKPVTSWVNRDEAFADIAKQIRHAIESFDASRRKQPQGRRGEVAVSASSASNAPPRSIIPNEGFSKDIPAREPLFFHTTLVPLNYVERPDVQKLLEVVAPATLAPRMNRASVVAVTGIAGNGKSLLVKSAVTLGILPCTNVKGLFWYSFYEARSQSSDEFFSAAVAYFGSDALAENSTSNAKKVLLWKQLQRAPAVIVLDGLEYLQNYAPGEYSHGRLTDRTLRDFIRGAIDISTSCIIVTSRIGLADLKGERGYLEIPLGPFCDDEALTLMRRSGLLGTSQEIQAACQYFGNHPLSLRILADYVSKYCDRKISRTTAVLSLAKSSPVSQKLDGLFSEYWNHLDDAQRFFLSRLSALRVGASEDELSMLVKPREDGKPTAMDDPSFRTSLHGLEDSALIEVHQRGGKKFFTAPALLRMFAYDRMSDSDRVKTHDEWIRYTEGIPLPSAPTSVEEVSHVIELIYHCIRAKHFTRAWEIYNRRGKLGLSRTLIDWGAHEVAREVGEFFWSHRVHISDRIRDPVEFSNELIAFYSAALVNGGRIGSAVQVVRHAPTDQYGVPLIIRVRTLIHAGLTEEAEKQIRLSASYPQNTYSKEWSRALAMHHLGGDKRCLIHFRAATDGALSLARGFLGFLYFDYVSACIAYGDHSTAGRLVQECRSQTSAAGIDPYLTLLDRDLGGRDCITCRMNIEVYKGVLQIAKERGDVFLEALATLRLAHESILEAQYSAVSELQECEMHCHRTITLCQEAGEGVVAYAFPMIAAEALKLLYACQKKTAKEQALVRTVERMGSLLQATSDYWARKALEPLVTR